MDIESSITRDLKDYTLKKGGLLGGFGATLLLVCGVFLPLSVLRLWGLPILMCGLLFVTVGLRPYRQLCRLEMRPHRLLFDGESFTFSKMGKPLLYFTKSQVDNMRYVEQDHLYGVIVKLKRPIELTLCEKGFAITSFFADTAARFDGYDLFFPYFTKKKVSAWVAESSLSEMVHVERS